MKSSAATLTETPFPKVLLNRLNEFFVVNHLSKKGNPAMTFKVVFALTWWALSYALLYVPGIAAWQVILVYMIHGFAHVFIVFNIAHDANHNALSGKRLINRSLSYAFDLCGVNSYMWRILHHRGHHFCPNIHGEDESIIAHGLFRLSPHAPLKKMHRYQHLYALFLYSFVSLDYVFFKDFEYFFFSNYKLVKDMKHPRKEYIILFLTKALYFTYILILPIVLAGISVWVVLAGFFIMHLIVGLTVTLVFQTTHVLETAVFPESRDDFENYIYHILATTADYSAKSPTTTWLLGGLNLHVIHHFYPHVCHVHFPHLTQIVKDTAREYGVEYRENPTMYKALKQHFALLRQLGKDTVN